jgi:siderophore synthetase component
MRREAWEHVNRALLAKAVAEWSYEGIIELDVDDAGRLRWSLSVGTLTARGSPRTLGGWRIDPASISWTGENLDAAAILASAAAEAGARPSVAAAYLSELSSTLWSDVVTHAQDRPASELIDLEPVLAEQYLGGHPWLVANKGRVGFSTSDVADYAPEGGSDVCLMWVACHPSVAGAAGLEHRAVMHDQVGQATLAGFDREAAEAGLDPATCVYVPVHPWQWTHRIEPLHAAEIANGLLVPLEVDGPRYRPQLAIRTLTDIARPDRRYLKLPLSILNTSVYRGLPRERTLAAPSLTSWLQGLVSSDAFLRETGLVLLGETASVSVAHRGFERLPSVPYQYTEMLGAIWRESVAGSLQPGEQAISLAAMLHVDRNGGSVVEALMKRSGLDAATWMRRLHESILPPLLHVLYKYGAMFSPHGQNCMIIHSFGVPTRLVVKDFVDDVAICAEPLPEHDGLTDEVRSALNDVTITAETLVKYLHGGLIVGVYRYLAELANDHLGLPEPEFWTSAREVVGDYQHRFASELGDRYDMFDVEASTFPKLCLNRLRLFERAYEDDPERPVISAFGDVPNPLSDEGSVV